ncbi:MAG TPA: GMC family oxidoreductase [Stellaceae bacterium]|nr:GMC family oxidoreductase [Stellaceae bacterium]
MIVDARALPQDSTIAADIAIIGAGAAGITIARSFLDGAVKVALIESGGLDFDAATQDLYDGDIVGHDYFPPTVTRLRYFGGSTNHWDGLCRPLDPSDFARRPDVPDSGWPFDAAHLDPYYRRAQSICQLGPYDYEAAFWRDGDVGPLPISGGVRSAVFQNSPPTRFASVYGDELRGASNITVYLNANLLELDTVAPCREVTGLALACLDGKRLRAKAMLYVLACGGIENPRLLLNSDRVATRGLGNDNDLVGRYFMDHPKIWKGSEVLFATERPDLEFYDYHTVRGTRIQGVFVPVTEVMLKEGLANFAICLDHASLADVSASAAALRTLKRNFGHGETAGDVLRHLARAIGDVDSLVGAVYDKATGSLRRFFSTRYWCDCPPQRDSRITLSDRRDALGQRRVRIDWRLPADFARNFQRAHALLAEALGSAGLARLHVNTAEDVGDPIASVENSHHHMGTTRMHVDPRHGVVDADCRVHGIANLFIAGSSVFPTYGQANPTLTIVALALRLADHLREALA